MAVELFVPDAAVVVLPFAPGQDIRRTIGIVWHKDRYRSRAAEAFVDTAIEVAANIALPSTPVVTSRATPLLV
jgi:DNA-binding transcriptional LysR family regulator